MLIPGPRNLGIRRCNLSIFSGLFLNQEENIVNSVLAKIGANSAKVQTDVNQALERKPKVQGGGEVYLSSGARQVLKAAKKEADKLKDEYISTEHLLLAILKKYIEKDAALERRFQQTYVGEPSVEETISILRGVKEKLDKLNGELEALKEKSKTLKLHWQRKDMTLYMGSGL